MTTQQPEALRLAAILEGDYCPDWFYEQGVDEVAAELRRQHARIAELEAQVIRDCMTHVQNPAENEHVAGDVSKNGTELNMTPAQPVAQQEAQEPVAWYVTGCCRLLDEYEAKAEARHIGGTARAIPLYTAPQADSQPAHQRDPGYPPLPRPDACDGASGTTGWSERAMRAYADATCAMRAAQPAEAQQPGAALPVLAALVSELRKHRFCGDCYPESGWPGVNNALAQYAAWKRASHGQAPAQAAPAAMHSDLRARRRSPACANRLSSWKS